MSPKEQDASQVSRNLVNEHVRLLDAATTEDAQVLLTELLVHVYPTSGIQDS